MGGCGRGDVGVRDTKCKSPRLCRGIDGGPTCVVVRPPGRAGGFSDVALGAEVGGEIWDRFAVHYTPKHGSWLDQAEIELSLFSRQCLGARRIPDLGTLQRETKAWNRQANRQRTTINWRFTRRKARKTFRYERPRRRRPLP